MTTVRIEISGGIAELTEKPDGVRVILVDYDDDPPNVNDYPEQGPLNHEDCGCLRDGSYVDANVVPA